MGLEAGKQTRKSVVRSCTRMEFPLLLRLRIFCLLVFQKGLCHTHENLAKTTVITFL